MIPHKTKQFLVLLIKVLIVVGAFYFIYDQLANNDKLDWVQFTAKFKEPISCWNWFLTIVEYFESLF
jgi:hypothetical protein